MNIPGRSFLLPDFFIYGAGAGAPKAFGAKNCK